ncbi:MAG: T9SS type A sorting domain-containing protein [Bacteroidales bacterium]|nr:T9SS type A sorting domain-containing protein [Bacteroidales bacterium]MCF8344423.1 T9SS type A sorting domain-containing protein [Bacteroidales bacterium]MCF8351204.1 T9SS type A sorting domain-containing protein [Bacteroidales bacterium]MCF8377657.1 T9SS type A sorting domain-containing protein [Bacteroidales bacterium]MCF8402057.1 T9SS type A sorting domain-containing protein [Bacteroidales bacterium]
MKKILSSILMLLFATGFAAAQTINMSYTFDKPVFITDEEGYTELIFENAANFNEEGHPLIPHFGCKILLPQGAEISNVEVVEAVYSETLGGIKIKPASREFPISEGAPDNYKVEPDEAVYTSDKPYPENPVLNMNTQYLNGHSIGQVSVCPVIYYPAASEIKILQEISLKIEYNISSRPEEVIANLRHSPAIEKRVKALVDNPGLLTGYTYAENRDTDEVDILLITNEALDSAFMEYVEFKESTGFIVTIETVGDIYINYTGADEQEQIRNCIIDYYQNHGISYVILGGDSDPSDPAEDVIPHRGFYANDEYDIPSNMYYSCLDGNWNDDSDNRWGEVGEYDAYAEVAIGNICVDNETEITNFTNKLKMYQDQPVLEDIEKTTMVGEMLNNNPLTWGGTYKDQIAEGSSAHGFTTEGVSDNFYITYIYDRDMSWNKYDIYELFNDTGVNLLNHLGHSNVTYNMKLYNSDVTTSNFTNNGITRGFPIGYSQGCYNGSFDNRTTGGSYIEDCFAEKITTLQTGYVACISNSRYGWYSPANTNSSSQFHDRQFFDAIFGEDITEIGYVNTDAVADNADYMDEWGLMRWVAYTANLFGDPSMDIWTAQPEDIMANYPASVPLGISSIMVQTNVAGARVGLCQEGELIGRGITDSLGDVNVLLFEPLISNENIALSIIAHNHNRLQDTIVVVNDEPYVMYEDHLYIDESGNGNGMLDCGESILMSLDMKNVGNQPATDVTVTIRSTDEYLTLTDTTEFYGDFEAGEIISKMDAFAFEIADSVPDGHTYTFTIIAEGENLWNSYLNCNINAPLLALENVSVDDTDGNDNGYMDPGETVILKIRASNIGHCNSGNAVVNITSFGEYLDIETTIDSVGIIDAGDYQEAEYSVVVADDAPIGTFTDMEFMVEAIPFQAEMATSLKIGVVIEDFESGDFATFDWLGSGDAYWEICDASPFEGTFCARSGEIDDNDMTRLFMLVDVMVPDSISFFRKVSTEADYDYLKFYIDNTVIDQWAGEQDWERVAYAVGGGEHLFQWIYKKDQYESGGDDCGWVDYICLPASETYFVGVDEEDAISKLSGVKAYPNPFSDQLNLVIYLDNEQALGMEVYNMNGQLIKTLAKEQNFASGLHRFAWNGTNESGQKLSSGIYYVRTVAGSQVHVNKIILTE